MATISERGEYQYQAVIHCEGHLNRFRFRTVGLPIILSLLDSPGRFTRCSVKRV